MPRKWLNYDVQDTNGLRPVLYRKEAKNPDSKGPFDFQYFADERQVMLNELPALVLRELILAK